MASLKKTRSGTFQLCVRHKQLPKRLWAILDTCEQADQYGTQLERLLAQGIVPPHRCSKRSHPSERPGRSHGVLPSTSGITPCLSRTLSCSTRYGRHSGSSAPAT
jgi:hypothetical protein